MAECSICSQQSAPFRHLTLTRSVENLTKAWQKINLVLKPMLITPRKCTLPCVEEISGVWLMQFSTFGSKSTETNGSGVFQERGTNLMVWIPPQKRKFVIRAKPPQSYLAWYSQWIKFVRVIKVQFYQPLPSLFDNHIKGNKMASATPDFRPRHAFKPLQFIEHISKDIGWHFLWTPRPTKINPCNCPYGTTIWCWARLNSWLLVGLRWNTWKLWILVHKSSI